MISLFEKRIQENSDYKQPCVLIEKKGEIKLISEQLFELATVERMQKHNIYNMVNAISFLILPNFNSMPVQ